MLNPDGAANDGIDSSKDPAELVRKRNVKTPEPICVSVFKWGIIVAGLGMLAIVLYFMGDVIYAWFSGNLAKNQQDILARNAEWRAAQLDTPSSSQSGT